MLPHSRRGARERGAAVVDFVLVTIPLVFLFLGIMQVGFALHVRNTLAACAADGARAGADLDRGPGYAEQVAEACIAQALNERQVQTVQAGLVPGAGGIQLVRVQVRASLPVLGPLGPAKAISVTGRAVWEGSL